MVKFYTKVTGGSIYKVDFENENFEVVDYFNGISDNYIMPEDGVLEVTLKDGSKKTIEVKKHDLVLKLHSTTNNYYDKEYIVIDNPELKDYYRRRIENIEANRKAREATMSEKCCCDCEPERIG